MILKRQIIFLLCLFTFQSGFGSETQLSGTKLIDKYLSSKAYAKADSALQRQIAELKSKQLTDSLIDYIYYLGKVKLKLNNAEAATKAVTRFSDEIEASIRSPRSLRQLYLELGSFYNLIGNPEKALESNIKVL